MGLCKRLLCRLVRLSGCFRCPCTFPSPDQNSAILVSREALGMDNFFLEVFDVVVINRKASLECPIRHPSLTLEERNDLFENVVKCHVAAPLMRPRAPSLPVSQPYQTLP